MKKLIGTILLSVFVALLLYGSLAADEAKVIKKTFDRKEYLRIRTVIGGCEVTKAKDDRIHVTVTYDIDPDDYEAEFDERENKLILREHMNGNNIDGDSYWKIKVPDGTRIRFNSATGGIDISGLTIEMDVETGTGDILITDSKGEFEASTGTGDIIIKESEGEFEVSTGTGKVEVEDSRGDFEASSGTGDIEGHSITIDGEGKFNSGTGDAEVKLPQGTNFDLTVVSGTGSAILNCAGKPIEGYFEFTAKVDDGRIISPIKFDGEEEFYRNRDLYERKFFTRGDKDTRIFIKTGTGKAKLKK